MSDIVEQKQALPVRSPIPTAEEIKDLIFSDWQAWWDRFEDWKSHGKDGAHSIAAIVYAYEIRRTLEENHPHKRKYKAKDYDALLEDWTTLVNFTDDDFFGRVKYPYRQDLYRTHESKMEKWYKYFLTQSLRECAVRLHARGYSTVNAIKFMLSPACETATPFSTIGNARSTLEKSVVDWLTPRLAPLKKGSPAFPKKYLELWDEAREAYLEEIQGVVLTETSEQVKALSELYMKLSDAFDASKDDNSKARLSASMVKVMSGLYTLTKDPSLKPIENKGTAAIQS